MGQEVWISRARARYVGLRCTVVTQVVRLVVRLVVRFGLYAVVGASAVTSCVRCRGVSRWRRGRQVSGPVCPRIRLRALLVVYVSNW